MNNINQSGTSHGETNNKYSHYTNNELSTILQNNQQKFFNGIKEILEKTPEKTISYIQDQQQLTQKLSEDINNAMKSSPYDYHKITNLWLNYQNKQFNNYLDQMKTQNDTLNQLVSAMFSQNASATSPQQPNENYKDNIKNNGQVH